MVDSAHGLWVAVGSLHPLFQWHLGRMDTVNTNLSQEDTCLLTWGWSGDVFLVGNKELDLAMQKKMNWIEICRISGRIQYHTQIWRLHSLGWCFYPSCNFDSCTGSIYQLAIGDHGKQVLLLQCMLVEFLLNQDTRCQILRESELPNRC